LRIDLSPDHKTWPQMAAVFVDDDGAEEATTVTTEELNLESLSSLLDEFSKRGTGAPKTLTPASIVELLAEFASMSEGVAK
jgi:hypothetical protein